MLGFVPAPRSSRNRRCSTSPSASSARPSCRIISTCIPPSCRRANSSARRRASARRSSSPRSIPPSRSCSRSSSMPASSSSPRRLFIGRGTRTSRKSRTPIKLLSPSLGVGVASTLFAVALLASGQNSTLTGTLAGQIVMEGFLNFRLTPWLRRLITRGIAIVPAVVRHRLFWRKQDDGVARRQPGRPEHAARLRRLAR